jgi:protein RecA
MAERAKLIVPAQRAVLVPQRAALIVPQRAALAAPAVETRRSSVEFMPSGSTMLDRVLGGGWAISRVGNLVGDKSSGKTLLAIELSALWARTFGLDDMRYVETEDAFDTVYAESIGMPRGLETENAIETVEQWYDDLASWLGKRKQGPCLYILDSLDALSDAAEMDRDIDKGSYGAAKAKKISELFRKLNSSLAAANCLLLIVSQIRDKIGVTFGETKMRSGGKALDFYASQVIWLAEKQKLKRIALGAERVIGAEVIAQSKKNKVAPPFRKVEMTIIFQYGVDDEISMMQWLHDHKALNLLRSKMDVKQLTEEIKRARQHQERDVLHDISEDLRQAVNTHWQRIEDLVAPPMKKYGD